MRFSWPRKGRRSCSRCGPARWRDRTGGGARALRRRARAGARPSDTIDTRTMHYVGTVDFVIVDVTTLMQGTNDGCGHFLWNLRIDCCAVIALMKNRALSFAKSWSRRSQRLDRSAFAPIVGPKPAHRVFQQFRKCCRRRRALSAAPPEGSAPMDVAPRAQMGKHVVTSCESERTESARIRRQLGCARCAGQKGKPADRSGARKSGDTNVATSFKKKDGRELNAGTGHAGRRSAGKSPGH